MYTLVGISIFDFLHFLFGSVQGSLFGNLKFVFLSTYIGTYLILFLCQILLCT